ncbi:MAG: copper transporter [Actinomycetota bacterium]|nr:copper transporter [Actinomycetota bacterium]
MPDLRYHVISLISVFLALAIGVLLGTAMADRGVISDQLQNEVTNIQNQLDQQRELIAERDARIATLQESVQGMSEAMISGELQEVEVALVYGPWADEEVARNLQSTLSDAGADLTSFERLPAPAPEAVPGPENADTELLYADLATETLGVPGSPGAPEVVIFLGGGAPPQDAPEGAVETLMAAEKAMFEVWLEAGVRVVAAEPADTERSEIPLFQDIGVTSVDNADQAAGRAAIVQLATSLQDGSYGIKPTASDAFPPASG